MAYREAPAEWRRDLGVQNCGAAMMNFIIKTGGYSWTVVERDWKEALRSAWKSDPPLKPGMLTSITCRDGENFIPTIVALRTAGYEVRPAGVERK